ncbi:PadR family transcriptional regulator [Aquabacter spiritensis]|uniref:PadR family transcriptional regulator n=1 Tax=Aquabacter spiritensis TaxID=933073 RepID=A0A4R3M5N4_9HYPH|nr:PadR family transcriptional regulator [Aquabacter spiritensis]TCT08236.1 PadR family transcriptional regulator [Aquabacter spiritensis]
MFGCRSLGRHERYEAGRYGDEGGAGGFGRGGFGRGGRGGGDMFRLGRMLAQGDLKLLALSLIAEQPRHGYEIIKVIEEKTAGWYSPSPGVVYPTLTFLEEAGYVTAEPDGAKKRYAITPEGRAHLDANRDLADALIGRLSEIGLKMSKFRRWMGGPEGHTAPAPSDLPRLVVAALEDLKDAAKARLEADRTSELRIVEILSRAANEVRGQ